MFITISSTNDEFLVVIWKDESEPLMAFEIASGVVFVSKCVSDSKPDSFIMDIIGGIKRNSQNSIQVNIENDRLVYHGPSMAEFISEITKDGVRIEIDKKGDDDEPTD